MKIRWLVVLSSLVMLTGCDSSNLTSTYPDVKTTFLNYTLPNRTYGLFPSDSAGGPYGTGPYTMRQLGLMASNNDSSLVGGMSISEVFASSVKTTSPYEGNTLVFTPSNDKVWSVKWDIDNTETDYWVFQNSSGSWVVAPSDGTSRYVMALAYQ